jgi:DNA mismatch repair endonuclease MutH
MSAASAQYEPSSRESILHHAERLVGHSLREVLEDLPPTIDFSHHKGGFGTVLERHYFGYEPNSRPEPDFPEAGVELKATPLKRSGRRLVSKERLVLGMIDYMTVVSEEWESSTFLKKNSHLLIVFYLHEKDTDPRDFVVKAVRLWDFPEDDLAIIRADWQAIVDRVRAGRAHELSEGDTLYLGAATKSSTSEVRRRQPNSSLPAKPRAFALKQSYMNAIAQGSIGMTAIAARELARGLSLEQVVASRFASYLGLTADEIACRVGVTAKPGAKNYFAVITKRILGAGEKDRIAEFEKADLQVKTMRILPSGRPKEDLPFRAFDYCELVEQEWESSELREVLGKRFLFVIYQLDRDDVPRLVGTRFWTMPVSDIDGPARACFDETKLRIAEDRAEYLPKKSESRVCHVRPHGRDSRDLILTPTGRMVCRKSFWLNGAYIKEQLGL